jgi:hypothetical protein
MMNDYVPDINVGKIESDDCISRKSIKQKLQENYDFFVNAYGGFGNLPQSDKSRVDEISNCIAMVVNEPPATPKAEQTRWIPCSERLPMNDDSCCDDDVLVSCKDGFVRIGFCMGYDELGNREWCVSGKCSEVGKYSEVVAWMPLPSSYQGESEGE